MRRHAFALGALVLSLAACGGSGGGGASDAPVTAADIAHGRTLFQAAARGDDGCGFCHALAAARTTSPLAADLDSEVSDFRRQPKLFGVWGQAGASEHAIRAYVLHEIANPACEDPHDPGRCMPKELFTGNDARDVAAFIAKCATRSGRPGCKPVAGGMRGLAARGRHLFLFSGCVGCHWALSGNSVGPSLHGLYGARVQLRSGQTVTADDRYLERSILEPDRQIVKGFPAGFMSSRISAEHISAAQARALVAYIKTLK